jgi:hypothetical protein
MDSSSQDIESATSFYAQMTSVPELSSFTVTPSSYVTGETATYMFGVTATISMYSGYYMSFTFPSDITLPDSPSCSTGTYLSAISCSNSGSNTLKATFTTFSSSPLSANTQFTFTVSSLSNPYSTEPTDAFSDIYGYDSSGNEIF